MTDTSGNTEWITAIDNLRRETDYRFEAIAARFVAQEQATQLALSAAKEAVIKAELAQEKRFDTVTDKIDVLTQYMDKLAGSKQGTAAMMAIVTFVISIVVFAVNYGFSKN